MSDFNCPGIGQATVLDLFGKDMSHEAVLEYSVTRHLMLKHAAPVPHDGFRPA